MDTQQKPLIRGTERPAGQLRAAVPFVVAAVAMIVSPLGLAWLYSPANPAAKTPALTLNFGNLHDLTSSGAVPTTGLQQAYLAWLGWTLIVATILVSAAFVATRRASLGVAAAVVAVAGLVFTILGVKGPMTWSQLFDQIENIRVGGYLLVAGYLITLVAGLVLSRQSD